MATALAERLSEVGVRSGDKVAFRLARGLGPVVAMLAAMRLGAAFVPLDDEHPDEHHAYVLQDSGAAALVIDAGAREPSCRLPVVPWQRTDESRVGKGGVVSVDIGGRSIFHTKRQHKKKG